MTKAYNDIDAVTRLLEEKEKDLELAAKIGQQLLERNKQVSPPSDIVFVCVCTPPVANTDRERD